MAREHKSRNAMYCPTCGKETPDQSTFCLNCGARIAVPTSQAVSEWEYRDYAWELTGKNRGWLPASEYTGPAARLEFWHWCQETVINDLEELAKEGWHPVVNDLPSGVQIRCYKGFHIETIGWIIWGIFTFFTFGLGLISLPFMAGWYYEQTGYKIQLKRPKR